MHLLIVEGNTVFFKENVVWKPERCYKNRLQMKEQEEMLGIIKEL